MVKYFKTTLKCKVSTNEFGVRWWRSCPSCKEVDNGRRVGFEVGQKIECLRKWPKGNLEIHHELFFLTIGNSLFFLDPEKVNW